MRQERLEVFLRRRRRPITSARSRIRAPCGAACEDYRASATIGLVHDQKDKIELKMPLLALRGKQGVIEALFDCLAD